MSDYPSPGVYVVENHSLSLDIKQSETAVPAFLCATTEFGALTDEKGSDGKSVNSIRIHAWLDVARKAEAEVDPPAEKPKKDAKTPDAAAKPSLIDTKIYRSLQAYFENGGGPCYVLNGADATAANHIKILQDVTLLVQSGVGSSDGVTSFCQDNRAVFGIIDAKIESAGKATSGNKSLQGSPNIAAYYPSFIKPTANAENTTPAAGSSAKDIPASAVMAGIYCRVDRERGVWKAPANVEVCGGLVVHNYVSRETQDSLYSGEPSVNFIRGVSGKSPIVWGARTAASKKDGHDFRYVPVRRLFNAVEKDIKATLSLAVFEPNSSATWERVRGAIDNYLHALWKKGALIGDTPDEAYLVQVGLGVTMTDDDLRSGKMIVKVALAPSRPAEFIVLQFSQNIGLG